MTGLSRFRPGFSQWRRQAGRRRRLARPAGTRPAADDATANHSQIAQMPPDAGCRADYVRIGEFVISPEGDPRLLGHPQIRY